MNVTPRLVGMLALVALLPVGTFAVLKSWIVVVSVVNVLLIAGCLATALSPTEHETHHEPSGA